ncbi:MAG: AraC family transcriptional regulator [Clostridia bacterium]|nr:AraC family transcriptional regulator [Clostridia bacterium]
MANECKTDSVYFAYKKNDNIPKELSLRHCHDKYEILYVVSGTGKYVVEGIEYPVSPGTLMIFPPLAYHLVQIDSGAPYERYLLHFDRGAVLSDLSDAMAVIDENAKLSGAFYTRTSLNYALTSTFEKFDTVNLLPESGRDMYSRLLLGEIINYLSLEPTAFFFDDRLDLGTKVIRYLNLNVERPISLDQLSKRFFVSKYYLCRAFKERNGISIHGYITQKRVTYAKQLIEAGESASNAAYKVGFGDYSAFYRAYLKIMGRAPTQKEGREKHDV